jgi:TRAP-type mannitol/chloroaromatic compound transport system permease small subunit
MERLLALSNRINAVLQAIASAAGWIFFLATFVIVFDVITRKFGFQIPGFGSTRLQELEWHCHAALFSFWIGFAYVKNAHVRVDIALAAARPRTQAWVELAGCVLFALPYCLLAIYLSGDFAWLAFKLNEHSDSVSGLPYRVVPKTFLFLGLVLLLAAVLSVMTRVVVYLFGPEHLRSRSAFAGAKAH